MRNRCQAHQDVTGYCISAIDFNFFEKNKINNNKKVNVLVIKSSFINSFINHLAIYGFCNVGSSVNYCAKFNLV